MRAVITGAALLGLTLLGTVSANADSPAAPGPSIGAPAPASTITAPAAPQETPTAQPGVAPKAPPMIMNLLNRPMESQEAAFRESIKQAVRSGDSGPRDGTIRIGGATVTIVVKDACPDGEMYHDMDLVQRPRPGRTRR